MKPIRRNATANKNFAKPYKKESLICAHIEEITVHNIDIYFQILW
ncbi:hypothetical protein [Neobacillus niacini]